jgi:hypothetical protein
VLFTAHFTKLADDQFLTALARVSLLYETQATSGRVLNSRAVHQGQPRIKRSLCLALVGALELLSATYWNILISILNQGLGDSRASTSEHAGYFFEIWGTFWVQLYQSTQEREGTSYSRL